MSEKYMPQRDGEWVRVVLEGPISQRGMDWLTVGRDLDHQNRVFFDASHVVSVEKLPEPEPEWQPGDVVQDALGTAFVRTFKGEWCGPAGIRRPHDYPKRRLTRMVPEGEDTP